MAWRYDVDQSQTISPDQRDLLDRPPTDLDFLHGFPLLGYRLVVALQRQRYEAAPPAPRPRFTSSRLSAAALVQYHSFWTPPHPAPPQTPERRKPTTTSPLTTPPFFASRHGHRNDRLPFVTVISSLNETPSPEHQLINAVCTTASPRLGRGRAGLVCRPSPPRDLLRLGRMGHNTL